jgi:hypothetical protein
MNMIIITPSEIEAVAWEGELVSPETAKEIAPGARPIVTIGRHTIWPAAQALESETGRKWSPPLSGADFWLVRLACTLRQPGGPHKITEATQTLYLRPKNPAAGEGSVYAHSLFPERLTAESKSEFSASLGPELKFGPEVQLKAGEVGAKIEYRKVFPVIQSYGAGEAAPYWLFKPHAAYPLAGSQHVYAVVAAEAKAGGVRATLELVVTVETRFGPLRFGLPESAQAHVSFSIP